MRCGTPVTVYVLGDASGSNTQALNTLDLGADQVTCSGSAFVVLTQAEYAEYAASPVRLGLEEAASIGSAVLLLWALGFAFRTVIRMLREPENVEQTD